MSQQLNLYPQATGEYLKQQRCKRNLSLAEIASAIGLDEDLLRSIEAGEAQHIAAVYQKGYIRAYAEFLNIPDSEISTLVEAVVNPEPKLRIVFPELSSSNPIDRWLRGTSYVLGSFLIGTLVWQFTHEAVRLSQNESLFQFTRERSQASNTTSLGTQTFNGPVNASITSLVTSKPAKPALAEGESRLLVSVSADSWIEITDALGRELEMDLLRGGNEKTYQGRPPFRMLFGRAAAVKLSVDGDPVDLIPFTYENVARITWPQVTAQPRPE